MKTADTKTMIPLLKHSQVIMERLFIALYLLSRATTAKLPILKNWLLKVRTLDRPHI